MFVQAFRIFVLRHARLSDRQRMLLLAALVGVFGAFATTGFRSLMLAVEQLIYGRSDGLVQIASHLIWWQRLIAPALGGLLAGWLLLGARKVPGGDQKRADYMEAIVLGDGKLGVRLSCLRALSSFASVVSGGAIGREGPMVQLAAVAGSLVGRWRSLPEPRRRLLVACGAASGVTTAYNAPIAGAVFIAEIVLGSFAIESLGPLIVSAVAANIVVSAIWGVAPVYQMPQFKVPSGLPTTAFAALGLAAGLMAPVLLALLDRTRSTFCHWKIPTWLKLMAGGLGVGAISIMSPAVWGNGYSVVNSILQGGWTWQALVVLLIFKILAVSMTVGSGAVGGVFTPILFVGAVTGALFGGTIELLWPALIPASASVAVGMGAFLAACTHAPLMSVLMIFEMTENFSLIVPLMLSCVLAYFVSRVLRPASIYSDHARSNRHAPSLSMAFDFLRLNPPTIRVGESVAELEKIFLQFRWQHVYVTNADGEFKGAISLHDFSPFMRKLVDVSDPWPKLLLQCDYPRVTHEMAIWQLMEVFAGHPGERLPMLDDSAQLIGYLTKTDIVLAFREKPSS